MINIKNSYSKYFFLLLFLGLMYLSYVITRPFIPSIIIAALLVYIFNPLYKRIYNKTQRKNLSSFIVTLFIIIIITFLSIFILNSIIREAAVTSVILKQRVATGNLFGVECKVRGGFICRLSNYIKEFTSNPKNRYYIDSTIRDVSSFTTRYITNFIIAFPKRILDIIILFFVMFYLFRDGGSFIRRIKDIFPIKEMHKEQIIKQLNEVTYAILYGYIVIGIMQGILGTFIFLLLGISSPIIWGIMIMILSILPFIGPTFIWLPASLFLFSSGYMNNDLSSTLRGVILLLYGLLLSFPIDNILKPKIIGDKTRVHPTFIIIGVIGGTIMFGIIGFLVGPLILALLVTFIDIYEKEKEWFKELY